MLLVYFLDVKLAASTGGSDINFDANRLVNEVVRVSRNHGQGKHEKKRQSVLDEHVHGDGAVACKMYCVVLV